jgi:hypothetical protein
MLRKGQRPAVEPQIEGSIRLLDHCTFAWRRRETETRRTVSIGPTHCGACVQALRAIATREELSLSDGTETEEPAQRGPGPRAVLRDEAVGAMARRHFERAAELYQQLAELDPFEPGWLRRAGEAEQRAGQRGRAADSFARASRLYAARGFASRARQMCRLALELDAQRPDSR